MPHTCVARMIIPLSVGNFDFIFQFSLFCVFCVCALDISGSQVPLLCVFLACCRKWAFLSVVVPVYSSRDHIAELGTRRAATKQPVQTLKYCGSWQLDLSLLHFCWTSRISSQHYVVIFSHSAHLPANAIVAALFFILSGRISVCTPWSDWMSTPHRDVLAHPARWNFVFFHSLLFMSPRHDVPFRTRIKLLLLHSALFISVMLRIFTNWGGSHVG